MREAANFADAICRLQDYYVKDWADNFMIAIGVDDAHAWWKKAQNMEDGGSYKNIRVKPPENVGDSLVTHVVDPSGVLLAFVQ